MRLFSFPLIAVMVCMTAVVAQAQTTPTLREGQIGSACTKYAHSSDFDTLAQCNNTAAGTMQKAPLFVGVVTAPPYTTTTCDANKAGMIQWTGSAFQGCTGSSWTELTAGVPAPTPFSFTDQTGVAVSSTITSNTVGLNGFSGTIGATCNAGCTAIARNGVWGGIGVSGFVAGDTIAIRQTSSALYGAVATASVTVGGTTSGIWSATTTTPGPLNFADQNPVLLNSTITSDTVALVGTFSDLTATCGTGCTGISRNGAGFVAGPVSGFQTGDTIAIQQTSSASNNTATTASVTIGGVTSGTWTVTSSQVPGAFSFTNQTGVNYSSTITSNTVSLPGTFIGMTATCGTGCTGISRNGAGFVAGPVSGFQTGDTIAIQQTSSAAASTATTASVTVGGTLSGTWSVTTSASPSAFSFTNVTAQAQSSTITSNTVALAGTFSNLTATCGTGCTAISRNGAGFVAGPVSGFQTGDTIAIQQTSSATANTASTASVTVGLRTSSSWQVTTGNCLGSGNVCTDGTVYAGLSPDGSVRMFTTRCDAGQTWSGTCTGTRTTYKWGTNSVNTGYTSQVTGETNTTNLVTNYGSYNDGTTVGVPAAAYCDSLSANTYTDWYLPAYNELAIMYANSAAIGNFAGNGLHSSTETSSTYSKGLYFPDGSVYSLRKIDPFPLRCVRK